MDLLNILSGCSLGGPLQSSLESGCFQYFMSPGEMSCFVSAAFQCSSSMNCRNTTPTRCHCRNNFMNFDI